jgi:hypothetical protein
MFQLAGRGLVTVVGAGASISSYSSLLTVMTVWAGMVVILLAGS